VDQGTLKNGSQDPLCFTAQLKEGPMLHIVHLIERRYPGKRGAILLGAALASAGLLGIGALLASR
jgi:hypothetical protein